MLLSHCQLLQAPSLGSNLCVCVCRYIYIYIYTNLDNMYTLGHLRACLIMGLAATRLPCFTFPRDMVTEVQVHKILDRLL